LGVGGERRREGEEEEGRRRRGVWGPAQRQSYTQSNIDDQKKNRKESTR